MADATALRQNLLRRVEVIFTEAQRLMTLEIQEVAPLGATGETRRGISSQVTGVGPTMTGTITATGKGGEFVEKGTPPHVIVPRTAKALRFLGGSGRISQPGPNQRIATRGGGVVFAKVVHHPGTPARPWFDPVMQRFGEFLQRAQASVH